MKKLSKKKEAPPSIKHKGKMVTPMRVASRLEGVVKNIGIKPEKKKPLSKLPKNM